MDKWGGRKHPHFEIIDGRLRHLGVIGVDQSIEDSPDVFRKEISLTAEFLSEMDRACASKNVRFIPVLFPQRLWPIRTWPPPLLETLLRMNCLDLRHTELDYTADGHPSASAHERIAAVLGNRETLDGLSIGFLATPA